MNQHDEPPGGSEGIDDGLGTTGGEGLLLPPWERRERYGLLNALYLTVKDVLLAPQRFFHRMPSQVGLTQPWLFAVILGVFGAFLGWMWALTGSSLQVLVADDVGSVLRRPATSFLAFLFSPLTVTLLVFVRAVVMHAVMVLVGGNRLGFEATFRVAAYGEAASIVTLVPFCGAPVAVLWGLAVAIIGLYSIHETDPWRAVVAVLAPMLLCLMTVGSTLLLIFLGVR